MSSGLHSKAGIARCSRYVLKVPDTDLRSFDNLISSHNQRIGNDQCERGGGPPIDDQLEPARLNNRKIGRASPLEDSVNIGGSLPEILCTSLP